MRLASLTSISIRTLALAVAVAGLAACADTGGNQVASTQGMGYSGSCDETAQMEADRTGAWWAYTRTYTDAVATCRGHGRM